jgi:hypothetical protein
MVQLLEAHADRWVISVDVAPKRRVFKCEVPKDATDGELTDFMDQVRGVLRKRRASDREITHVERKGKT